MHKQHRTALADKKEKSKYNEIMKTFLHLMENTFWALAKCLNLL